ncbi:MAG: 4Fe-4S dicluster domain-containing protein [Pseudomonadota bacterium]
MQIKPYLKQVRRVFQLVCLVIFLALFRLTDYSGSDTLPYAVNVVFRLDPLVAATVILAKKTFVLVVWPSLIIIGLTVLLGRVFCSWACPLGTLIDMAGHFIKPVKKIKTSLSHLKYWLLTLLLVSSAFGVQLTGFFDPFSLLVRTLVFSIDPGLNYLASLFFDSLYTLGPPAVSNLSEPVYDLFKAFILPYRQSFFYLTGFSFLLLGVVFMLEMVSKRFWCRNLCPLGGLLAVVSKVSIFKRVPVKVCKHCELCESSCRMNAFAVQGKFEFTECNLCMDCLEFCPDQLPLFKFAFPQNHLTINMDRRKWLTAGATGLAFPVLSRTSAFSKQEDDHLIRPPGALNEIDFLATCVRCGECMKVCINNALQPLFLEQGIEGMFTPILVPRLGYCEFNCTLCSQVCPTGAINRLDLKQKHAFVMGKACFDKNRCLVYADQKSCIVCEEHCPTYDKAIKFNIASVLDFTGKLVELKQPYVDKALCVGCGICEYVCPVQGDAAIRVVGKPKQDKEQSFGYG